MRGDTFRMRSKLYFTSEARSGWPPWNLMPRRSLKVHTVPSAEFSQESASKGDSFVCASQVIRVSQIWLRMRRAGTSVVMWGSSVPGSP